MEGDRATGSQLVREDAQTFPLTGWNTFFFGDLHIQGTESIHFYTQQKMTMTRWFESPRESPHDPVWKTGRG